MPVINGKSLTNMIFIVKACLIFSRTLPQKFRPKFIDTRSCLVPAVNFCGNKLDLYHGAIYGIPLLEEI